MARNRQRKKAFLNITQRPKCRKRNRWRRGIKYDCTRSTRVACKQLAGCQGNPWRLWMQQQCTSFINKTKFIRFTVVFATQFLKANFLSPTTITRLHFTGVINC
ncbi:hypothetical protein Tsp_03696 [Trichinella spiralis]|uniref:hypothetical protein n=1 Tax=Trichinella spiralis TaxID=6334 RepID=UPI0001EFB921|nr:hypothetical protein Tsp_03696 [Trichinella spiralis]